MDELRKLLRLAWPISFAQAGYALMGLVDTAVVGRLGAQALGAIGLANGLFIPIAVMPFFLESAGIEHAVAHDAGLFLWLRLPGLWPMLAFAGLRSYLQSAHRLRALVIATVVANLANFGLDILL